eukprot:GAHX01002333.1.p1 GENE.GAHX01002333.1~~GAHX01002333.1.p1  ORF type:complete len:261 (-),score=34.34 GAHX01002333.1:465-1247(-)
MTFMIDKDFSERRIIREYFKTATIGKCLFHALKAFKRNFTYKKLGLTTSEREEELGKIHIIIQSQNMEDLKEKCKLLCDKTKGYFYDNWYPIYYEWIEALKPSKKNLEIRTTSHSESIFSHIKRFAKLKTDISTLITDLEDFFCQKNINDDWVLKNRYFKINNNIISQGNYPYNSLNNTLTEFAFEFLKALFNESNKIRRTELNDDMTCKGCNGHARIGIPCIHQLSNSLCRCCVIFNRPKVETAKDNRMLRISEQLFTK